MKQNKKICQENGSRQADSRLVVSKVISQALSPKFDLHSCHRQRWQTAEQRVTERGLISSAIIRGCSILTPELEGKVS